MKTLLNFLAIVSIMFVTTRAQAENYFPALYPPIPNLKIVDIQNQLGSALFVTDTTDGEKNKDGMPSEILGGQLTRGYFGDHGNLIFSTLDGRSCSLKADYNGIQTGELAVVSSAGLNCELVDQHYAGMYTLSVQ